MLASRAAGVYTFEVYRALCGVGISHVFAGAPMLVAVGFLATGAQAGFAEAACGYLG